MTSTTVTLGKHGNVHLAVGPQRDFDIAVATELPDETEGAAALRELVSGHAEEPFDRAIQAHRPDVRIHAGRVRFTPAGGAAGSVVALVLDAAAGGQLPRLRVCDDCGWAFYDSSRNNRRRWCAMEPAGSAGRGCGGAAKARQYRDRHRHP